MRYISHYPSPLGDILLEADETGLTGLWFEGQKYFARGSDGRQEEMELPVLEQAKTWLDCYFSGGKPEFAVPLHFTGTDFQKEVGMLLCSVPYGETVSYGEIAKRLAAARGSRSVPARAVGGAVARNAISVIVPCHRVVGADGNLTGYAGGLGRKIALLKLEGAWREEFYVPKHGSAL